MPTTRPDGCPSESELAAFHQGKLSPDDADRLAEHVEVCDGCERELQGLDAEGESIAVALRNEIPIASGAGRTTAFRPSPLGPPDVVGTTIVGRYKLVEPLGEGGMGAVYMAQQIEPVRRLVALKLIKPGMDSRHVLARFEAERQALALMDHPSIAKVLDAGTTEYGRPFFVMELVKGTPITRYCDDHKLDPRGRLELFVQVCQAVQHAHQKGVIHRDLKPSNILVARYDGHAVPKVIDFGIAKATGQQLTDRTLVTGFGAVVGTPEYMAPEQAEINQIDIDTRADVYSLGIVLYELLTGNTPLTRQRIGQAALLEVLRLVREEDPPTPSTRLSHAEALPSIAANRGMEPRRLARLVQGELDWIAMKSLEKDRSRRYETANALARDVQRYLADEPVEAGRPSASYRLRKFARKYRRTFRLAAAGATLLVGAAIVSLWQTRLARIAENAAVVAAGETKKALDRVTEEQAKAKEELATRLAVQKFFLDKVFIAGRPVGRRGGLGPSVTLCRAIDAAESSIAGSFEERPSIEAAVRAALGDTYYTLGEPRSAIRQHERALSLREAMLGPEHPDTLQSDVSLASAYLEADRAQEASKLYEKTLVALKARLGPDDPVTLHCMHGLAIAYENTRRFRDAISLNRDTLALRTAKLGPDHPDTLMTMNNLGSSYFQNGQYDLAAGLFEQTLALRRAKLGPDDPETIGSLSNLASAKPAWPGHQEEAIKLVKEALALVSDQSWPRPPAHGPMYEESRRISRPDGTDPGGGRGPPGGLLPGPGQARPQSFRDPRGHVRIGNEVGANRPIRGSLPAIQRPHRRARSEVRPRRSRHALEPADSGPELSRKRSRSGCGPGAARGLLPDAGQARARRPRDDLEREPTGRGLYPLRAFEGCGPLAGRILAGSQGQTRPGSPQNVSDVEQPRLRLPLRWPAPRRGPDPGGCGAAQEGDPGPRARQYDHGHVQPGRHLHGSGSVGSGQARVRRLPGPATQANRGWGRPRPRDVLESRPGRLLEHKDYDGRTGYRREALAIFEKMKLADHWMNFHAKLRLGGCLLDQKRYADAESPLKAGYEGLRERRRKIPRLEQPILAEGADWLIQLYEATGKPDEVAKWRAERATLLSVAPVATPK